MSTRWPIYLPRERWRRGSWRDRHITPLVERINEGAAALVTLLHKMIYRLRT